MLLIDNYDSFTYNLYQGFRMLRAQVFVRYNDAITLGEAEELRPTHLLISPGPGNPQEAGISNDLIRHFHGRIPVLGVCLGHQCIATCFGGSVVRAPVPVHGKTSPVYHDGLGVFHGLRVPFDAARYHSLTVSREGLPEPLEVSAHTDSGEIMGLRLRKTRTEGVQFHPESFLTQSGLRLMKNFLEY
jgi:anthranilate synthase/aminodeoxychorismate synthase-like glutamine amidotransferase